MSDDAVHIVRRRLKRAKSKWVGLKHLPPEQNTLVRESQLKAVVLELQALLKEIERAAN